MLDKVLCVRPGCRPVKSCPEGLAYEGSGCCVVPAESGMDFGEELPSFLFGDASLDYSGSTFLVELSFMDFVGLRASHNTTCLILVLRKLLPI